MKNKYRLIISTLLISTFLGCEEVLEVEPVDSIADQSAITDIKSAGAAREGLYNLFNGLYLNDNILLRYANMSDEQNSTALGDEYTLNTVQPTSSNWASSWVVIRSANNIIQKLPAVNELNVIQRDQFISEAKFIRALEYLLLMQFFGDIPWTEETDYRVLQGLSRTPITELYANIISDLIETEQALPVSYESDSETRTRITKGAVKALLARTYLYQGNWSDAENKATEVISNGLYELQTDYQSVFTKNSTESILELFSDAETHLGPARFFFPNSLGGLYSSVPTNNIKNAFEGGDQRIPITLATDPNGLLYVNKYRDVARTGEFQEVKVFRLAEMYLILSEAKAQQGDIIGAAEALNVIRNRAGLANTTANDQASMLKAIEQERLVELCFEGHRWIDLVRTGRVHEVMGAFNPNTWQVRAKLLPIPQSDIDLNPNLTPNPGY